jgi:hypothetical protein
MVTLRFGEDKTGDRPLRLTVKAEAVKKLASLISEADLNEDYESIKMYADVIEYQLNAMLRLVREIREASNGQQEAQEK